MVIQVMLLNTENQLLRNNYVINHASTSNEGGLNIVYERVDHLTEPGC